MKSAHDNEAWILHSGDAVIPKKASSGSASLTAWELLVYCLWVLDYGMRNAGDLEGAAQLKKDFRSTARGIATQLSLSETRLAFSLPKAELQSQYFKLFDLMCDEIKNCEHSKPTQ
jgi:hypothetical protein